MSCTNETERENDRVLRFNNTEWRQIGSKEAGKKMIGL